MQITREQAFLHNRIAILVSGAAVVAFLFAGLQGFAYWFVGFVLALWLGLALWSYTENSSLWLAVHKRNLFLRFYAALVLSFFIIDQVGLQVHLWFSPLYHRWLELPVYFLLLPLGGLVLVEILNAFQRDARLPLLIMTGTLMVAISTVILPPMHIREWIYLGVPLSLFFNIIFFGIPIFAWVGSLLFAAVPLTLWRVIGLSQKAK